MTRGRDRMTAKEARRKWRGYPVTLRVALVMLDGGWRLHEQTNGHVSAFCPHGHPSQGSKPLKIYSTPRNDGNHARRLGREISACPEHHDRLDQR